MIRLSNIRIGTKLAVASGIAILLVAGMMISQFINDHRVNVALAMANRQKTIAMNAFDFKASARGLFLSVRDIRLATNVAMIKTAQETAKARRGAMTKNSRSDDQADDQPGPSR